MRDSQHTQTMHAIGEISEIKTLIRNIANTLRQQDSQLRQQGFKLSPLVIQRLGVLVEGIAELEKAAASEMTELTQLKTLVSMGALINSSLDIDAILAQTMDDLIALTGAERGFIVLKNPETAALEFRIARDTQQRIDLSKQPEISMTVLNEVIDTGEALLTENAYKDPRIREQASVVDLVLRSVICVPLKVKGAVIGALYVDNRLLAGLFTQRELILLTAFANQTAVAIQNARYYQRIRSSLEQIVEMKEQMESVFVSVGSGIIATNSSNEVTTFNRAASQILAMKAEEVLGKRITAILPTIISSDSGNRIDSVLRNTTNATMQVTAQLTHKPDPVVLSYRFSPLRDAEERVQGLTMVIEDLTEKTERDAMIEVLEKYLPPGMMGHLNTISNIGLGGERRDVTCMFAEVRAFSSFESDIAPHELMESMNEYLAVATDAIHQHEGVIDKYMGTEIMVLFNTQMNPCQDHALRAIQTALEISSAFTAFYQSKGIQPQPHYYRIGINSGVATLGNVGSLQRCNFTAIGDTINLAKRIEENSQYGQILIGEETLTRAQQMVGSVALPNIRTEERPAIQVKGRQQFTRIFEAFRS